MQKSRRFYEGKTSRFGRPLKETGKAEWPLIQNRYQIVEFLGKGGFSEVYTGFDLVTFQYIACKIHHLKSTWSDDMKMGYIKHALRESDVLILLTR